MKLEFYKGTTRRIIHVFLADNTSTTGAGKTALAFGDITAYYVRAGGTLTALTMETIATLGTWTSTGNNYLGFKKLDDTDAPGLYELNLPNNILASGANQVVIQLRNAGIVPCNIEIQLKSTDLNKWYVTKNGNDNNGGHSIEDALLTIGAAITAAAAGDTIIIYPGTYAENVDCGSKSLTIIGATNMSSCLIAPTTGRGIVLYDNCTLKNLGIQALEVGITGQAVYSNGKVGITIEDCDIYGAYDGIYANNADRLVLRNCKIRGKYDAINVNGSGILIDKNMFIVDGSYGTGTDSRCIASTGFNGIISNNILIAARSDTTSKDLGGIILQGSAEHTHLFNNNIAVTAGTGVTGKVYGIYFLNAGSNKYTISNCRIVSSGANSVWGAPLSWANGAKDLAVFTGTINLWNTFYSTSGAYGASVINNYVDAAITSRLAPTTSGRTLDVSATGGIVADSLGAQAKLDVNAEADTANTDYGANKTTPPTTAEIKTAMEADNSLLDQLFDSVGAELGATLNDVLGQTDYIPGMSDKITAMDALIKEDGAGDLAALKALADTNLDAKVSEAGGGGTGLTAQETRDAMKLAPSSGDPATDSIDDKIENIVAGSGPTVEEITADLMDEVNITVGGTWTLRKLLKIKAADAVGKWRLKAGQTSIYEVLDAEDGTTVIFEVNLTTGYKIITVKI